MMVQVLPGGSVHTNAKNTNQHMFDVGGECGVAASIIGVKAKAQGCNVPALRLRRRRQREGPKYSDGVILCRMSSACGIDVFLTRHG